MPCRICFSFKVLKDVGCCSMSCGKEKIAQEHEWKLPVVSSASQLGQGMKYTQKYRGEK